MIDKRNSVLIRPEHCALLFVDFEVPPDIGADDDPSASLHGLYRELLEAAQRLSVPIFASIRAGEAGFAIDPSLRDYLSSDGSFSRASINPWRDEQLRERLFDLDRNRLILAGGCSEGSLMQGALSALQDMYDVYVLFDLSDRQLVSEGSPMARRMIQSGVVPMTTRQLLLEWTAAENGEDDTSSE